MALPSENIVLYDWLSFTSKLHTPDEIIDALGLGGLDWTIIKGAHGYKDRKYCNSISIHYNGRDDMGVWCEMSGQGCRAFETLSCVGWSGIFDFIERNGLKITRLDVAFDDHMGILDISEIAHDTRCQNYVSRSEYWEVLESSKGTTCQVGSPKSEVLIRIYDKAAERGYDSSVHWVRVELQLRNSRAGEFIKIPLPVGDAFSGVLLNYLRYVVPNESDSNKWRWEMKDYWVNMLSFLSRISVFTSAGMEYNMRNVENYVFNQAGNAIECAIEYLGIDEFMNRLKSRDVRSNPKYDMILKRAKFEDLCFKVSKLFGIGSVKVG